MKRALALLFLCAGLAGADGPKFSHKDRFVDQEFTNVYQDIRNASAGDVDFDPLTVSSFTAASATISSATIPNLSVLNSTMTNLTVTGVGRIHGTNADDAAASGYVGEYISSATAAKNFPTTAQLGDLAAIDLTAGNWLVEMHIVQVYAAGTITAWRAGISTTAGNDATGLVFGDTMLLGFPATSVGPTLINIAAMRMAFDSSTTVYLKYRADYTSTAPTAVGRISATRTH